MSERSTKLTTLRCADALALVAYNGIGKYHGQTPADWLQELDTKVKLASMKFPQVLEAIREDVSKRFSWLFGNCDRRHTFVFGAWGYGRSWIATVSNYESLERNGEESVAQASFSISWWPQMSGSETRVAITGCLRDLNVEDFAPIARVAKKAGAAGVDIKNLCVRAIQKAAGQRRNRGAIGTSVLWAISERFRDVQTGLDVPGGTTIHDLPNMIGPSGQMSGVYIEFPPNGRSLTWDNPQRYDEALCKGCKNPIPLGYQTCGVCGKQVA